ncbi:MAG TPA: MFS transporter [Streptosporangiaceae bacterium]|jgi:CP family cyanate transporter-like MFS transporter|nr:MFS transporter [Streptosporangiaceae bacterium]
MSGPAAAGLAAGGGLLLAGILATSFNMRASITGLPPVFPEMTAAAGWTTATKSALAAMPVLSFAVFSGLAPMLARKIGEERVLGVSLVLLAAGLGLRSAAPGVLLFPGTIVAGCAIALVNVLLPSMIKRRRPDLAGLVIGLYLSTLTAGAVVGAVIAVPVFNAAGGTASGGSGLAVRLTLGMWALPALAAVLVWLPQLRFRTLPAAADGRRGVLAMGRIPLAWQVMGFMSLQSLSYYATLSWFPTMFRDHGISADKAGNLLALMNVGNAITGLIVPVLAHRARDQRWLAGTAVILITIGLAGSAFAPNSAVVLFVCLLGLGQGGAFGLSVFLFTARAADSHTAAALSGFAQGLGYLLASAGPLLIGLLHSVTGSWTVPVVILLSVSGGQFVTGLLASRDKAIGAADLQPAAAMGVGASSRWGGRLGGR